MQEINRTYPLSEVIIKILKEYTVEVTERNKDKLRKKIQRFTDEIDCNGKKLPKGSTVKSLWKTSIVPTKSRPDHYFTEQEQQFLLNCYQIREFVLKNCAGADIAEEYYKAEKDAIKANTAYSTMQETADWPEILDDDLSREFFITEEELKRKKFEMMIEALFLKFFTPIDEAKLKHDMEASAMGGGSDNTPESVMAAKRLTDVNNYLKKDEEP